MKGHEEGEMGEEEAIDGSHLRQWGLCNEAGSTVTFPPLG